MYELFLTKEENYKYTKGLRNFLEELMLPGYLRRVYSMGRTSLEGSSEIKAVIGSAATGLCTLVTFIRDRSGEVTSVLKTEHIMFAKNLYPLKCWGNELAFYVGKRKKEPDREFLDKLIWEVVEVEQGIALVRLPGSNETFKVKVGDVLFLDRLPTPLELRNQEIRLRYASLDYMAVKDDVSWFYPLNYFQGSEAEKVIRFPSGYVSKFNIWDELMEVVEEEEVLIDEALMAIKCCVYGGGWHSGSDPEVDFLHSVFFEKFTDEGSGISSPHLVELSYVYTVFMECVKASFKTLANYKKLKLI